MWSFLSFFRGHFYFRHNSNIWRVGSFKLSYWIVHDRTVTRVYFASTTLVKLERYGTLKNMGEPKMKFEKFFKEKWWFQTFVFDCFHDFFGRLSSWKGRSLQLWTRVYPAVSRVDFFNVGLVIFPSFLEEKKTMKIKMFRTGWNV